MKIITTALALVGLGMGIFAYGMHVRPGYWYESISASIVINGRDIPVIKQRKDLVALKCVVTNDVLWMKFLVEHGLVSPNARIDDERSPTLLQAAILSHSDSVILYLVSCGADIWARNRPLSDALTLAYDCNSSVDVKLCLTNAFIEDLDLR